MNDSSKREKKMDSTRPPMEGAFQKSSAIDEDGRKGQAYIEIAPLIGF
jgi:hypothetical protein